MAGSYKFHKTSEKLWCSLKSATYWLEVNELRTLQQFVTEQPYSKEGQKQRLIPLPATSLLTSSPECVHVITSLVAQPAFEKSLHTKHIYKQGLSQSLRHSSGTSTTAGAGYLQLGDLKMDHITGFFANVPQHQPRAR